MEMVLVNGIKPIIITIGGKIGSGKTTLSKYLNESLNIPNASFGDYIRKVAEKENKSMDRETLQKLGDRLISEGVTKFCLKFLNYAKWSNGRSLIIEGVRHKEVLFTLRELTYSDRFLFIYVSIDEKTRKQRIIAKNKNLFDNLDYIERHPTEIQVQNNLINQADIIISNEQEISQTGMNLIKDINQRFIS